MVDVYDVRRRCAQATAIAEALQPQLPPRHHTDLKSYNHHPQHHGKGQRYPPATATATPPTTTYHSNSTATPLRADNAFLKMTNATSSYPLYIKNVPYATASRLQTLDVCLPRPLSESPADAVWVVYIHGGAWRDPLVTSASIYPALSHLLSSSTPSSHGTTRPLAHIAGFASINYRLSPYPQHPTCPSLAPTTSIPARHEGRNVTHPTHVHDVATALRWLRNEYGVGGKGAALPTRDYVVVGHSCGATLACQLLDGWLADADADGPAMEAPVGVAGLCGIYNLPLLAENHAGARAYEEFLQAAFGSDESVWLRASPTQMGEAYAAGRWPRGRVVVLGASGEDGLVEGMQRDVMVKALEERGWVVGEGAEGSGRELVVLALEGEHDDAWREGRGLARAVECVVGRLFGVRGKEGGFF